MPNILSSKAMLARLRICQWSATRLDKSVTREINESHNASADAGRYNKRLVGKAALSKIQTIASEARSEHYKRTLPWSDEGQRLLSSAGFIDYSEKMRAIRDAFESAVDEFITGYPEFVGQARRDLNGLFNESDYPAAVDIRARFKLEFSFQNCPDAGDFRVDLGAAQVAEIQADMEARAREALNAATKDVWQRVADAVGHMSAKLREYKPGADGKRADGVFRDSLVDNVRELVGLLPSLNIAGDHGLAAIADRMRQELCADDAKALRDNAGARESVANAAESILADVSAYLA